MPIAWTAALVLAASPAAPTPVTSPTQLAALCTDLRGAGSRSAKGSPRQRALTSEWTLRLGPGQFRLGRTDPRSGTLTLVTQGGFRAFAGKAVLSPIDGDDFDLALADGQALPPSPDALALELVFRAGEAMDPPCNVAPTGDVALGIEVLEARLRDPAGKVVAELDDGALADRPTPPGGKPSVQIDPAEVEGSAASSDRLAELLRGLQPKLLACFEHALVGEPALDGVLVLGFVLGRDGRPGPITLVADSVQDEGLSTCVVELVKGLTLRAAPAKGKKAGAELPGGRTSVTLRFERH